MLQGTLFTIRSITTEAENSTAVISLHSDHPLFGGHFPGQPVLPGACQLQILKEILQTILNRQVQLLKGNQLKFLSLIDPGKTGILTMQLKHVSSEDNTWIVTAMLLNDAVACFKFNGTFIAVSLPA